MKSVLRRPPGHVICDNCGTDFRIDHHDPVEAWLYDFESLLRDRNPCLFAAGMEGLQGSRSAELLNDAWWNITLRRHNIGIMVLGTLLEATLQDVLYVHRYERFRGELRSLCDYLRAVRVVDAQLLDFADTFRENVRNRWQHQKVHEITAGGSVHGVSITFEPAQGVTDILNAATKIRDGAVPLKRLTIETNPAIEVILKLRVDEDLAVPLYNKVWMWVNLVSSRYLADRHYRKLHARYDGPPPEWVEFKNGKRRVVQPEGHVGDAFQVLDAPVRDAVGRSGRAGGALQPRRPTTALGKALT